MNDALGEAQHRSRQEQDAAPGQQRGADDVSPRPPECHEQCDAEEDDGRGDQPGDLSTELGVEESIPTRQPPTRPERAEATDATGFVACQPAKTVVSKYQAQQVVVLRPTDIRARGAW